MAAVVLRDYGGSHGGYRWSKAGQVTQKKACDLTLDSVLVHVGTRRSTYNLARHILASGAAALVTAVVQGKVSLRAAAEVAKHPCANARLATLQNRRPMRPCHT